MQTPAVGVKVGHDFEGRDLRIECLSVLQVSGCYTKSHWQCHGGIWQCHVWPPCSWCSPQGSFLGGLGTNTDVSHGVVGNVPVIEGEDGRPDKLGVAMVGFVLGGLHEDGRE